MYACKHEYKFVCNIYNCKRTKHNTQKCTHAYRWTHKTPHHRALTVGNATRLHMPRPTKRCDVTWAILMRLVFLSSRGNARSSGGNTTVPLYVGHLSVIWWRWLLLYGSLERRYQLENLPNNVIHLVAWITMWRGKGFKYRTCTLDMTTNIKSYATICN